MLHDNHGTLEEVQVGELKQVTAGRSHAFGPFHYLHIHQLG